MYSSKSVWCGDAREWAGTKPEQEQTCESMGWLAGITRASARRLKGTVQYNSSAGTNAKGVEERERELLQSGQTSVSATRSPCDDGESSEEVD